MESNEVIKYLAEHLSIEADTYPPNYGNTEVIVKLKIGDVVISESTAPVFGTDDTE
tara:strand:- start:39 stop:206 length:168 start_codon:yes stop_codon:yes gene_type:complete